jgi:hypothetical protein
LISSVGHCPTGEVRPSHVTPTTVTDGHHDPRVVLAR